jgi:hypothetical protein
LNNKTYTYILLSIILFSTELKSQDNEIGFFFGGTNYIGDVGPTTYINPFPNYNINEDIEDTFSSVVGIFYRKNISNRFALKAGFNFGIIQSSDLWKGSSDYRVQRGKYFKNKIQEFHLGLDFNFLEFETSSNNFEFTPYIHTGLSLIRFDALHYPIGINEAQAYGKDNDLALPITVGIKMKPLNSFVVGLEISAKHSFTENLDGSYPEFDDSSLYSQRPFGSNLSQDWYVYSGITLTYLFGNYECDCTR